MKLKILSYNIHKGFTAWNKDFVIGQIREALRETDADILFLQEVLGEHSGGKRKIPDHETAIQFEYLADSVWPHFAYGKNAVYSEGHHGNAILSKFPIVEWKNYPLEHKKSEVRGLLTAKVVLKEVSKEIMLANTHLDLTQKGRNFQTDMIINLMKREEKLPWIMVGDFNDWNLKVSKKIEDKLQAEEAFKRLHGKYPKTFPSFLPLLSLDRVFLHKLKVEKAEALVQAHWKKLSDHIPLYVEVDLKNGEGSYGV